VAGGPLKPDFGLSGEVQRLGEMWDRQSGTDGRFPFFKEPSLQKQWWTSRLSPYSKGAIVGLAIVLESEDGKALATVEDLKNRLHHLLPKHDDDHFQMIRFIDWYGDTVFNRLQAATFLKEWETLRGNGNSKEDEDLVSAIRELAVRLQTEPHLYLKFYGD
jgi:hypothetical protein